MKNSNLEVLEGLHALRSNLQSLGDGVASYAAAFSCTGNQAMCDKLLNVVARLDGLSAFSDKLANAYVKDAMGAAAESQKSLHEFITAFVGSQGEP